MPVVTFPRIFIHRRVAGLEDWRAYYVMDGQPALTVDAVREQYAAGNAGVVRSPRRTRDLAYTLLDVVREDVLEGGWFDTGAGDVHLIRDPRGRLHWAFWNALEETELPGAGATVDLPLALFVVTAPVELVG